MALNPSADPETPAAMLAAFERLRERLAAVRAEIGRVIYGQRGVIDEVLTTLLAGGHVLLVGLPGLGKTRLVETLGRVLGLETRRVQFTPDLMPADILGSEVLEEGADGRRHFRFVRGPVFTQLLMADEINRASPRTQSALLQAMQERKVAIGGIDHALPAPFHVLATQNPIEQEGTYPLPEAQLDRFFMEIDITYPERGDERAMLLATTSAAEPEVRPVLSADELIEAQRLVRAMPVGEQVVEAILELTRAGRPETSPHEIVRRAVAWGPGPRAGQALMLGVRALALLEGRHAPSLDDVARLAPPILRHRMALSFAARAEGVSLAEVIATLIGTLA
jgi:MoxR-like ATPase